jgi:hypothetical protein
LRDPEKIRENKLKKIALLLLVVLIFACNQPADVIKNYYDENGYVGVKRFVNQQVFPVPVTKSIAPLLNIGSGQSGNTPAYDHAQGVFYKENSNSYDDLIHTLDLGYLTGNQQALVYLEIKVIDHGYDYYRDRYDDEAGSVFIKGHLSSEQWKQVTPRYNEYTTGLLVLTGDEGKVDWYHQHEWNYWDNPLCEPGYEIYKWTKVVVNAVWLVNGIVVE